MKKLLLEKTIKVLVGTSCLLFLHSQAAIGGTINVDNSITDTIPGFSGFETTGANMTGLSVTATFSGNTSETGIWQTTDAQLGSGSASGSSLNWNLSVTGTTFEQPWTFTNNTGLALQKLVLDGTSALVVFDRTIDPSPTDIMGEGTPGSGTGKDFAPGEFVNAVLTNVEYNTATYSKQISLGGTPVGDVWHVLDIDFATQNNPNGLASTSWMFFQDTDRDARVDAVPLPSSLVIFFLGLSGMSYFMRFNRSA